jgi:hypothetical protein
MEQRRGAPRRLSGARNTSLTAFSLKEALTATGGGSRDAPRRATVSAAGSARGKVESRELHSVLTRAITAGIRRAPNRHGTALPILFAHSADCRQKAFRSNNRTKFPNAKGSATERYFFPHKRAEHREGL